MGLFVRWNDLTDRLVGKTARGKRPVIRWPKEINVFKRAYNRFCAGTVIAVAGGLSLLISCSIVSSGPSSSPLSAVAWLMGLASAIPLSVGVIMRTDRTYVDEKQFEETSQTLEPLLGTDPYLDLRLAAFLTVGAMPEWLRRQMRHESGSARRPAWLEARFAEEPYTVEQAGLDYLDLMSRIALGEEAPDGSFHGKPFPSPDHKLPDQLKAAAVEIILFLSSLPDSVAEPKENVMESVIRTIDRMATIDEESFTTAVQRHYVEDYNGEIMKIVDASTNAMDAKSGRQYEAIQRGMSKLSKISKASELSREPAGAGLVVTAATMK